MMNKMILWFIDSGGIILTYKSLNKKYIFIPVEIFFMLSAEEVLSGKIYKNWNLPPYILRNWFCRLHSIDVVCWVVVQAIIYILLILSTNSIFLVVYSTIFRRWSSLYFSWLSWYWAYIYWLSWWSLPYRIQVWTQVDTVLDHY